MTVLAAGAGRPRNDVEGTRSGGSLDQRRMAASRSSATRCSGTVFGGESMTTANSPAKHHPHIIDGPSNGVAARTPASGTQPSGTVRSDAEGSELESKAAEQSRTVSRGSTVAPGHDRPLPIGDHNENPKDISLLSLIAEDFRTHERDLTAPGFWAVALHRLGNARMGVHSKLLRAPLTVAYHTAFTGLNWLWGIDL